MTAYQWRFLLFAPAVVLVFALTTKVALPATACQTTGKTWRLIDGKRCWTDRYRPKSQLAWVTIRRWPDERRSRTASVDPRLQHPVASQSVGPTVAAMDAKSATPQSPGDAFALALAAKAAELRLNPPVIDFGHPIGTVQANQAPQPQPNGILVPMPRPRPPPQPQPAPPWLAALLLTALLLGNAATNEKEW